MRLSGQRCYEPLQNKGVDVYHYQKTLLLSKLMLFDEVSTDVESELAERITENVKGVNNNLTVNAKAKRNETDTKSKRFSQHFTDGSITAAVKSKLLLEDDVKGLKVTVALKFSPLVNPLSWPEKTETRDLRSTFPFF